MLTSFGALTLYTILIFISLGIFDLKILLAFIASVLVSNCGGGSAKGGVLEISATVDPGYIEDNLYFLEGEYRFIKPKNASLVKHIDIGSDSVIFTKFVNGQVYIVAPNIDQITEINLEFTIELNDGTSLTEQTKLEITPINLNIPETRPLPYAFASAIGAYDAVSLDSNGVPLYNYKGEITYHPSYIAAYAYNHYRDYYYHENESSKKKFLDASMWLRDQCVYTTYGFCSYRYFNIENEYYEVYSDWTSALAQGQALSSLIAASYLTDDSSYLDVAYDALSAFGYLAKDKGVMSFRSDLLWFEEYGSETLDSGVLNGFIFAMAGISNLSVNFPEISLASEFFDNGVSVLESEIDKFDMHFTSHYNVNLDSDKIDQIAGAMGSGFDAYHELHIAQLAWMLGKTSSKIIQQMYNKFIMYDFGLLNLGQLSGTGFMKKFNKVDGSQPINSDYGLTRLTDENWTYGAYWSTKINSAHLEIVLNEDVLETDFLTHLVLVFLDESQVPPSIEIQSLGGDGVDGDKQSYSMSDAGVSTQIFQVSNFQSVVKIIEINYPVSSTKIRIDFNNSGIIALREINVFYQRTSLAQLMQEVFRQ